MIQRKDSLLKGAAVVRIVLFQFREEKFISIQYGFSPDFTNGKGISASIKSVPIQLLFNDGFMLC
jgi:hypothetical protein